MREYFSQPDAVLAKLDDSGGCMYRVPGDGACAVGCLIPDEIYDLFWAAEDDENYIFEAHNYLEERGVDDIMTETPIFELFENVEISFLEDAQELHDTVARNAEHFVSMLDELARQNNLVIVV